MSTREVTMKYRTQKWLGIIRECQASGLSKRTWCEQNNVNEKTFYYWLRKLRKMACENKILIEKPTEMTAANIVQPIVPFTVLKDESAAKQKSITNDNSGIILNINSIEIKICNGTSAELIENTLKALKNIC
ncbi:IS66 family insertion sequence element accessory protein TnpA [uncultured Clostridium sp.]|uniref:IS66 family insertion sequence element accessory protein TnpA n=1 Tax=uncultured Clostridium sp. TaxID=59620 RepID=UPI0025E2C226|nr:IS66 family insertion sequence element accessory protein TnpB [uncultured Clostridium sp.]